MTTESALKPLIIFHIIEIHFQLICKAENGNPDSIKVMGPVLCGLALRLCFVKDKDNIPKSKA